MSKGDHIYVECFPHDHHGIDHGDGTIIYLLLGSIRWIRLFGFKCYQ